MRLGDVLNDVVSAYNALAAKFNALPAHLDTAKAAGVGNTNVTNFSISPAALTPINA